MSTSSKIDTQNGSWISFAGLPIASRVTGDGEVAAPRPWDGLRHRLRGLGAEENVGRGGELPHQRDRFAKILYGGG